MESLLATRWLRSQRPGPRIGRKYICILGHLGLPGARLVLITAVLWSQWRTWDTFLPRAPNLAFARR